jgi:hypothetical protein
MGNKSGGVARSTWDRYKNMLDQGITDGPHVADRISYGKISGVDYNTYQVQVQLIGYPPWAILGKGYWPLISQIDDIFHRYGQIRKGMMVRVHWRGKERASFAVVEIIGDEDADFFSQKDRKNEEPTVPYKLISGGIIP